METIKITETLKALFVAALKRGYFTEAEREQLKQPLGVEDLEIHRCSRKEHTLPGYVIPDYKPEKT